MRSNASTVRESLGDNKLMCAALRYLAGEKGEMMGSVQIDSVRERVEGGGGDGVGGGG